MDHVDDTMMELERRWVQDAQVDLDLTRSEATFLITVSSEDETRAISQARGVLSMAIHSAGGATPHRPFPQDAEWSVRLLATWAAPDLAKARLEVPDLSPSQTKISGTLQQPNVGELNASVSFQS